RQTAAGTSGRHRLVIDLFLVLVYPAVVSGGVHGLGLVGDGAKGSTSGVRRTTVLPARARAGSRDQIGGEEVSGGVGQAAQVVAVQLELLDQVAVASEHAAQQDASFHSAGEHVREVIDLHACGECIGRSAAP